MGDLATVADELRDRLQPRQPVDASRPVENVDGMRQQHKAPPNASDCSSSIYLSVTQTAKGYSDNRWATYKQISEMGGQVRKGEPATHVLCFKFDDQEQEQPDHPATEGQAESAASARPVAACGTIAGRLVPVAWTRSAAHRRAVSGHRRRRTSSDSPRAAYRAARCIGRRRSECQAAAYGPVTGRPRLRYVGSGHFSRGRGASARQASGPRPRVGAG